MHLVSVDQCLFFINRKNTFLQIMIRTREAKIKQEDGLITLKYMPASMKIIVFFMGVNKLGPHTHPWLESVVAFSLHSVYLTTPSHFIEESSRSTLGE